MKFEREYRAGAISVRTEGPMLAARIRSSLKGLGVNLPEALTHQMAGGMNENSRVNALLNTVPKRDYLAEAAALIDQGEDPDAVLSLHAGQLLRGHAASRVVAERTAAQLESIDANADLIIRELRTQVFAPLMERATRAVADYGLDLDLHSAIDAKDFRKAEVLSGLDDGFGAIATLHAVRQLLHDGAFVGAAAWTMEPDTLLEGDDPANELQKRPDCTTPDWWARLIHSGRTPHFPTLREYLELHNGEEHTDYRRQVEEGAMVFAPSARRVTDYTEGGRE